MTSGRPFPWSLRSLFVGGGTDWERCCCYCCCERLAANCERVAQAARKGPELLQPNVPVLLRLYGTILTLRVVHST